jgi:hypothetical protein
MVDELHILTQNRAKNSLAVILSGLGRGLRVRDSR